MTTTTREQLADMTRETVAVAVEAPGLAEAAKREARYAQGRESVQRAREGRGAANDQRVIDGFAARGVHATPRVDVFTYRGWQALGRQVRKGEHGVKLECWVPMKGKGKKIDPKTGKPEKALRRKITTVFHLSQTDETGA